MLSGGARLLAGSGWYCVLSLISRYGRFQKFASRERRRLRLAILVHTNVLVGIGAGPECVAIGELAGIPALLLFAKISARREWYLET
jgi:hypothetical protein